MISNDQREALHARLWPLIPNNPSPTALEAYLELELLRDIPPMVAPTDLATWMIDQVLRQPTPKAYVRLISNIDDENMDRSLVLLSEELEADASLWKPKTSGSNVDWQVSGDPCEVDNNNPFVDRIAFRELLPRPNQTDITPGCTLIQGDPGDGKSYLLKFCQAYSSREKDFCLASSSVLESSVRFLTPEMVATELANDLGITSPAPRRNESEHRHAINLVSWITYGCPQRILPSLIFLDHFDNPNVPEPIHTFISHLVKAVSGQTKPDETPSPPHANMRIILAGYDRGRLDQNNLNYQSSTLEFIGEPELRHWFKRRNPDAPDYRHQDAASLVHAKAPASGPARMINLGILVQSAQQTF